MCMKLGLHVFIYVMCACFFYQVVIHVPLKKRYLNDHCLTSLLTISSIKKSTIKFPPWALGMSHEILPVISTYCLFSKSKDNLISNNTNDELNDFSLKLVDEHSSPSIKFSTASQS